MAVKPPRSKSKATVRRPRKKVAECASRRKRTPREVAEIVGGDGVDEKTIRRWCGRAKSPCPHDRDARGQVKLDEAEVVAWMRASGLTGEPGRPAAKSSRNIKAAQLRKENALADRYEIMNDRERGLLVESAEVEREWANVANVVRAGFQSIGSSVVPIALGLGLPQSAAPELQEKVDGIAADILLQLHRKGGGPADDADDEDDEQVDGA